MKDKLIKLGYNYYRRIGNNIHFRKDVNGFFLHIHTDTKMNDIKNIML